MNWRWILLLAGLAGCGSTPVDPAKSLCLQRFDVMTQRLLPAFAAEGYQPAVHLQLDDTLTNGRGFAAPDGVMGDSLPSGRIRLRSRLCQDQALASIVLAHEMAHVALRHYGAPSSGVTLAWETPRAELEADQLAQKVLRRTGAPRSLLDFLDCRLGQCEAPSPQWKRKPVGSNTPDAQQSGAPPER